MTHHQTKYHNGHYFIVRFDSSARTQHEVQRTLKLDPRLLRFSVVKMGAKLTELADVAGKAEWPGDAGSALRVPRDSR